MIVHVFSLHANNMFLKKKKVFGSKTALFTDKWRLYTMASCMYILLFNPTSSLLLFLACKVQKWLCHLREALYIYHPEAACTGVLAYRAAVKVGRLLQI